MATNIFTQSPLSATGVKPGQWFLNSSEDYATITAPGFLQSVAGSGIDIQPNDFIFATYGALGLAGVFIAEGAGDSLSLQVYTANSNSFAFERTMFVAKGGSDLNPGNQMGYPKETIQAAINALMPNLTDRSLVIVMDDGNYAENLILPLNITVSAPNATIAPPTGDVVTITDSGQQSQGILTCMGIEAQSGFKAISLNGPSSVLFLNVSVLQGDIFIEGALVQNSVAIVGSNVTQVATGAWAPNILNAIASTFSLSGTVAGSVGEIPGARSLYGDQNIVDRLMFQTKPLTETAGRELTIDDRNVRIVYNNASDDNYTLPNSPDVKLPIGSFVEFTQLGLGAIYFVAGAGVTIVSIQGSTPYSSGPGATCKAYKYTDTIWIVSGDISSIGP